MKWLTNLGLLAMFAVNTAFAEDITTEQFRYAHALQAEKAAKSGYEADQARVEQAKEALRNAKALVSEAEKKLATAEKNLVASKRHYSETRSAAKKQQEAVNRAWKK